MALALEERTVKALETLATSSKKHVALMEKLVDLIEKKFEDLATEVATLNSTIEGKGS